MGTQRLWALGAVLAAMSCASEPAPQAPAAPAPVPVETPSGVRMLFDAEDVQKFTAVLVPVFSVMPDGDLIIGGANTIYDAGSGLAVVAEPLQAPYHFDADGEGAIFVVSGKTFGMVVAGGLVKLTELPAAGFRVATASSTRLYLYGPAPDGRSVVYALDRAADGQARIQQLLSFDEKIEELVAAGPEFLFAVKNSLYRAGKVGEKLAVTLVLKLAPSKRIVSAAFDPRREVLFIATSEQTWLASGNAVAPVLDFSGDLALGPGGETLYVYQAAERAAFKIDLKKLLMALTGRTP